MRLSTGLTLIVGLTAAVAAARADESQNIAQRISNLKARETAAAKVRTGKPYVVLQPFVCASSGASDADFAADLAETRGVYAACDLDVRAEPPREIASDYGAPAPCQLGDDQGSATLTPDQLALFKRYNKPDGTIHAFYLSWRAGPDGPTTAGTSFPADYIRDAKGDAPDARSALGAVIVFNKARRFTGSRFVLAHEMGHVLLADSSHRPEASNLMHGWDGGGRLNAAQCLTIRASPYVRRDPR